MRRLFWLVLLLLVAYVGYPYLTLYWLNQALLDDNKPALERIVDFPKVRANLKAGLKDDVLSKAQEISEDHPILGALGDALGKLVAPAAIDGIVDELATPEAILNTPAVVEHRQSRESFIDYVAYAFFASPTTFKVDLKQPDKPDSPTVTALMTLDGFRWRVTDVEVPPVASVLSGVKK